MSTLPADSLWQRLREAGLAQGERPGGDAEAPWFVRFMLGIAGWIGALFLFGFFALAMHSLLREAGARLFLGGLLCGGSALVVRAGPRGELLGQFVLAVSLAGQALLASGLAEALRGSPAAVASAIAAQQAILFFVIPGTVHRTWCAATAGYAIAFALARWGLGAYATAVLSGAFALAWLREFDHPRRAQLLRAAGYGLGVAAFLWVAMHGTWADLTWLRQSPPSPGQASFWPAAVATGAVVLAAAAALLRREGVALASASGALAMAGALIVAAASAKAPGIAPAAGLLVLGHANGNRLLAGLGIFALVGYLSHYYYSLHATLLEKSGLLAAAGIALLVARFAMQRVLPGKETRDA